jgi:hypothetical protein
MCGGRQVRGEEFQSDDAIQFDVAGLVDDTHPVSFNHGHTHRQGCLRYLYVIVESLGK